MSVIINELEVVVEAPPQASNPPAQAQQAAQLRPLDLEDVLERQDRYEWRVMAH